MIPIPAIDLLGERCVRLLKGDFDKVTYYETTPQDIANNYAAGGAQWLHVVDLAASRDGANADSSALFDLIKSAPQKVQTGGGVRTVADIHDRLEGDADRVVVGSVCVADTPLFSKWLKDFGADKLVAALDVQIDSDGIAWPRTHGWTEGGSQNLWQLLDQLSSAGLVHLLCTDISKDGALAGPNVELYKEIVARYPDLLVQASGGVSSLDDLDALKATGANAAIIGKALLDERFTTAEAVKVLT